MSESFARALRAESCQPADQARAPILTGKRGRGQRRRRYRDRRSQVRSGYPRRPVQEREAARLRLASATRSRLPSMPSKTASVRPACPARRPNAPGPGRVLEEAFEKGEMVTRHHYRPREGRFTVELELVRAFLPGSLVDVRPVRDPSYLEGKIARVQGHQARPEAEQRGGLAPGRGRGRVQRRARGVARRTCRKARCSRASSRT